MPKNLQDIIPDRDIVKLKNVSFGGLDYESYRIEPPVYSDQVESLLENGFMLFIDKDGKVFINKLINPSPNQLQTNKEFWHDITNIIDDGEGGWIVRK